MKDKNNNKRNYDEFALFIPSIEVKLNDKTVRMGPFYSLPTQEEISKLYQEEISKLDYDKYDKKEITHVELRIELTQWSERGFTLRFYPINDWPENAEQQKKLLSTLRRRLTSNKKSIQNIKDCVDKGYLNSFQISGLSSSGEMTNSTFFTCEAIYGENLLNTLLNLDWSFQNPETHYRMTIALLMDTLLPVGVWSPTVRKRTLRNKLII